MVTVNEVLDDLVAEVAALETMLCALNTNAWDFPTPALGWSVRDQIAHLVAFDELGLVAATDEKGFGRERHKAMTDVVYTDAVAAPLVALSGEQLRLRFASSASRLVEALAALAPGVRIPWYGPDMGVVSFATARLMEVWAHGQDVYDALGMSRTPSQRLRHVAELGVRTLGHSFRTHGLEVPTAPVSIRLAAPDGDAWSWGPDDSKDVIEGCALHFCLVVTRRRNVTATALTVTGPVARQWMRIAQTFAGPSGEGRAPGQFQGV